MLTEEQMREIALELQGTELKSHFGHPDFRVNNKIFATLWPGQKRSVLKLPPEVQAAVVLSDPGTFRIPPGGLRGGWTSVDLTRVDEAQFRELIGIAWTSIPKPRARKEVARKRR
jgi:predicted DNA-binding protein (MmcQ/YjbR family)